MIALIDTNILLDVIEDRTPHNVASARVWKLVEDAALAGYVSAISFNNIFYIARKKIGTTAAAEALKRVRNLFAFVPLDEQVIDRALAIDLGDFEDAIQVACAVRCGADFVVTRNVPDFVRLGQAAITPEEMLALLPP